MYSASSFDVLCDNRLTGTLADVWNNFGRDIAAAFQHTKINRLVRGTSTALASSCASADISFINLDFTVKRLFIVHFSHVFANLMRHTPCGFVGYAELALQLLCRNAMRGVGK